MEATLDQAAKLLYVFRNTPSEKMQVILESGRLADLRDGNIAEVDRDEFRKSLGLEPLIPKPEPLLEFLGTVPVPATTEKFIAKDHFMVDTSRKAKVKISYLGDNFRLKFLGKIEEPIGEQTLRRQKLRRSSVDGQILAELGGEEKARTTLTEMSSLMEKQPNGDENGDLLTNGSANIFYILDEAGVVWALNCHWHGDGWDVFAYSVEYPYGWDGGSSVFSRNS